MDTSLGGVRHPTTGQDLSVEDAVMAGVLDIPHASYNNVTEDNQSGLVNVHVGQGHHKGQDPGVALFGAFSSRGGRGMINGHADLYGDGDGDVDGDGDINNSSIPISEAAAQDKINPKTAKKNLWCYE